MTDTADCFGHVLVHGLGVTGLSIIDFLADKADKITVITNNHALAIAKSICAKNTHLTIQAENTLTELPKTATLIIKSPGISPNHPLYAKANAFGCQVISDIELFAQEAKAPIIGVTGTNGKSTAVYLITKMLQALGKTVCLGGNVGTPALCLLMQPVPDYYVLELSSFQLAHTSRLNASVGVLLNITPDHLSWHGGMQHYGAAKRRILAQSACVVLQDGLACHHQNTLHFSEKPPNADDFGIITENNCRYLAHGNKKLIPIDKLSPTLRATHNQQNCLAALGVMRSLKLPLAPALECLKHFKGLAHRLEHVLTSEKVHWYNDSKATNLSASIAAINSLGEYFSQHIIWLGGGILKETDFSCLKAVIAKHVKYCLFFGQDAQILYQALAGICQTSKHLNLEQAVLAAKKIALLGDVVLLSPGGASFDAFSGFADRGRAYVKMISGCQLR